nr:hypothetical protein Q903MT_gene2899 [Picea sitchensis]
MRELVSIMPILILLCSLQLLFHLPMYLLDSFDEPNGFVLVIIMLHRLHSSSLSK